MYVFFILLYISDMSLALWAGLAVGLAWLWVAIGEWLLAKKSMDVSGKNPELEWYMKSVTILGMALVETAAIYGLIYAILLLFVFTDVSAWAALAWGLAVGISWLGVGIGEGMLVSGAMDSMLRNPETKDKARTNMILYLALVETAAIYGLITAILMVAL